MTQHDSATTRGAAPGTGTAPGAADGATTAPPRRIWRTIDLLVTVTIGVAMGVVFLGLSYAYYPIEPLTAAFAPASGLLAGLWFLPAILAGLIVRKPGAALLAELIAAFVEMMLGGQWGWTTMISGLAQGLGVELGLALFAYRRSGVLALAVAGACASAIEWVYEAFGTSAMEWAMDWKLAYLAIMVVSGVVLSPLLCLPLARLLARTGVLDAFPIGRERAARELV